MGRWSLHPGWNVDKNAEMDMKVPASKFKKYVAGRMLWNYDNLEPAEKKGILG